MLIWLSKSHLPVATIAAPASLASQGQISGNGFAQQNTIGFEAMLLTCSLVTVPGFGVDIAIRTSAPSTASLNPPTFPSAFPRTANSHFCGYLFFKIFRSSLFGCKMPLLSTMITFDILAPAVTINLAIAIFAAPAPRNVILTSLILFPTIFNALISPAKVIAAVPC